VRTKLHCFVGVISCLSRSVVDDVRVYIVYMCLSAYVLD
jgi:hypothetical protein